MIASNQEIPCVEIRNYHMSRDGTTLLASITVDCDTPAVASPEWI